MFPICNHCHRQQRFAGPLQFAALVIGASVLAGAGCSKSENHVAVYPVAGAIKFQGQPASGAFVLLHPKSTAEGAVSPRAMVAQDGTFTLSTFNGNDCAPEGDYVLTVQWNKLIRKGAEVVSGPNVIPPKYSSPTTSDLVVHVAAGSNQLKPIQLR